MYEKKNAYPSWNKINTDLLLMKGNESAKFPVVIHFSTFIRDWRGFFFFCIVEFSTRSCYSCLVIDISFPKIFPKTCVNLVTFFCDWSNLNFVNRITAVIPLRNVKCGCVHSRCCVILLESHCVIPQNTLLSKLQLSLSLAITRRDNEVCKFLVSWYYLKEYRFHVVLCFQ